MTVKDDNKTITLEVYFDDLSDRAKDVIINIFGDNCNCNWDVFPMFTMEMEKAPDDI